MESGKQGAPARPGSCEGRGGGHGVVEASAGEGEGVDQHGHGVLEDTAGASFGKGEGAGAAGTARLPVNGTGTGSFSPMEDARERVSAEWLEGQSLESAAARKGKIGNSASRSRSGSNQLEPIPVCSEQTSQQIIAPVKAKIKRKRKQPAKK